MPYQPLYGRITDNQGGYAHSLVLRGKVDSVNFWLNSWFGEAVNLSAKLIDGKQIVAKPELRKIRKEQRKLTKAEYEAEVSKENKVIIDIDIPANQCFSVRINGIEISYERLKMMEEMKHRRFDIQIEALKKLREKDRNVLHLVEVLTK